MDFLGKNQAIKILNKLNYNILYLDFCILFLVIQ